MTVQEKFESIVKRKNDLYGSFGVAREELEIGKNGLVEANSELIMEKSNPYSKPEHIEALQKKVELLEAKKNKAHQAVQDLSSRLSAASSVFARCAEFLNHDTSSVLQPTGSVRGVDLSEVPSRSVGPQPQLDGWAANVRQAWQPN